MHLICTRASLLTEPCKQSQCLIWVTNPIKKNQKEKNMFYTFNGISVGMENQWICTITVEQKVQHWQNDNNNRKQKLKFKPKELGFNVENMGKH